MPSPSPTPVPSPAPSASPRPSPIPSETPYLYLLIQQTEYGFVSANTDTGAVCTAISVLPNGQHAPGIQNPKVADWAGHVSWWYPAPAIARGTGEHFVTCKHNGLTGTGFAPFDIKED